MHSYKNPFVSCTARDMSFSDVMDFWCSPYKCYKINEADLELSPTPIIIEGARGSGKTMILKHLSYNCQKNNYSPQALLQGIASDKYLGVYFRYSADYSTLFELMGCSLKVRQSLFEQYFHLCFGLETARILKDVEYELSITEKQNLFSALSSLLSYKIEDSQGLIAWLKNEIQNLDVVIRRSQYDDIIEFESDFINLFFFDMIRIIHKCVEKLNDVLFVIIIDEYENVGDYQRIINTYIKQMDGQDKYTFRIGVRPEGIKDYSTNVSDEFLQSDRDFVKKQLIIDSGDRTANYKRFVKEVINKRLRKYPVFSQHSISIEDLLGKKENYDMEAKACVGNRKDHFSEALLGKSESERKIILSTISDSNPLVEAYFLMRLKRGDSIDLIKQTKEELANKEITERTEKYKLDMQAKYKPALLFWLIDCYRAKKMYYSFATFLYLSCGSIYDFICLCRTVFDELESDFFGNIENNTCIPSDVQTKAATKYAQSQLEKIRINRDNGSQMSLFVQNMCSLLKYYHKGDLCIKYPETNQFYISGNFDSAGFDKEIWKSLLRWGIVIKKPSIQRASLAVNSRAQLYYINKSYYPAYGISCRIRGGYNIELSNEMWYSMTTSLVDPIILNKKVLKKRKSSGRVKSDITNSDATMVQMQMFDSEDPNE